jgi:tRNA U34 5-methylaminomethyl-2-thiouridine-forming methyltransferase MnmC
MERKIILTGDGSHSISVPELNVAYHSIHGAIQESLHVFIEAGFRHQVRQLPGKQITILEVGFGTGLNALLTAIAAEKMERSIYYVALEPNPLNKEEFYSLNYCELLGRKDLQEDFLRMHECEWNKSIPLTEELLMHKSDSLLQTFEGRTKFDLIYFDAFAPNAQPELWTKEVFDKMYSILQPGGILVTYCSKGDVRRNMIAAGFEVEKLPGPPGKREMIRATLPTLR